MEETIIVKVICTAENGEKKEYTVTVKRAAAHDGSADPLPDDTSSDTNLPGNDITTDTDTNTDSPAPAPAGLAWWWLIVTGIGGLAIGFVVAFFIFKNPNKD